MSSQKTELLLLITVPPAISTGLDTKEALSSVHVMKEIKISSSNAEIVIFVLYPIKACLKAETMWQASPKTG